MTPSMSPRQERVQKLIDLRERRLDQTKTELARARDVALVAERALAEEERRLARAAEQRAELAGKNVPAREFCELEAFRQRSSNRRLALTQNVREAHRLVEKARDQVRAAHTDLKKLETLEQHIVASELAAFERRDRREHDEIAAQRARGDRKETKAP